MRKYNHQAIEKKWQNVWEKKKLYQASDTSRAKKFYPLIEFPFPSGAGLHTGHIRSYTALDILARKRRMQGQNVLYPIGWDAFGLPTENFALKTGIPPEVITKKSTDTFRRQLKSLGISFDWSREINTTDPNYYKWTQWLFLQFYKKGLAYKAKTLINWCPKDKIGLANEEVVNGCCERCGTPVEKREKEQWMLAITKYAERLDKDLDKVAYREDIKLQQRNWIGRSVGAEIPFILSNGETITVFTTRADTLFGATYLVLAPEHKMVEELRPFTRNWAAVEEYRKKTATRTEIDRTAEGKEKTGVILDGVYAINPATKAHIPVWVADYVLANYGTGAVMAVPAHDGRDFSFAKKFNLAVKKVLETEHELYEEEGVLINSGQFNTISSAEARRVITAFVKGKIVIKYKLRDWVFSRQRYWGEPIPLIYCEACGWQPVPEKELPVKLPKVKKYEPTDTGESPLAAIASWIKTKCPKCKGVARRETDTMPNWAGSSWYFIRYTDPHNKKTFADRKKIKKWLPVDWYNGGMEHTTLHLLYSRFWYKFLYDLKLVPTPEPYSKRTSHGLILAEGGEKMSKSKGNTVNPDDIVKRYGADTLRLYEMFIGPFEQAVTWNTDSIIGPHRFIERIWKLTERVVQEQKKKTDEHAERMLHKTIEKVESAIETMQYNTAVSQLMICANEIEKSSSVTVKDFKAFIQLLAPFAPHMTEELWQFLGEKKSIHLSSWPKWDKKKMVENTVTLVVQINGKMRSQFEAPKDIPQKEAEKKALALDRIKEYLVGKRIKKIILVPNRVVNIVVN